MRKWKEMKKIILLSLMCILNTSCDKQKPREFQKMACNEGFWPPEVVPHTEIREIEVDPYQPTDENGNPIS